MGSASTRAKAKYNKGHYRQISFRVLPELAERFAAVCAGRSMAQTLADLLDGAEGTQKDIVLQEARWQLAKTERERDALRAELYAVQEGAEQFRRWLALSWLALGGAAVAAVAGAAYIML